MTFKRCGIDMLLRGIIALLVVIEFVTGIYESIYVNKSKQFGDECGVVRTQVLVYAIVDIVTAVVTLGSLSISFDNGIRDNNMMTVVTGLEFIMGLWAVISFHTLADECYNFWTTNVPELLIFVKIHYAVFWIFFGFFFFGLIGACIRDYFVAKEQSVPRDDRRNDLQNRTSVV